MLRALWGRGGRRGGGGMVVCSSVLVVGLVMTGAIVGCACGAVAVAVV